MLSALIVLQSSLTRAVTRIFSNNTKEVKEVGSMKCAIYTLIPPESLLFKSSMQCSAGGTFQCSAGRRFQCILQGKVSVHCRRGFQCTAVGKLQRSAVQKESTVQGGDYCTVQYWNSTVKGRASLKLETTSWF